MSLKGERFSEKRKEADTRSSNIVAAKAVADCVRTSLGPRGMDKMIETGNGDTIITNDGATILSHMQVFHPCAKMLVEVSKSQDIEAGDGTTSVVVLSGSLLNATGRLLKKGIHPTLISQSFQIAEEKAEEILMDVAKPVDLRDREALIQAASTSLASKVVSQSSDILAPLAVDAVMSIVDPDKDDNVDLRDIKVIKALGGTLEDTELIPGLVLKQKISHSAGAKRRIESAKIGLIQFCLSAPKTDMENQVVISDYASMDRIVKEERKYILNLCKKIKAAGCNVLLVQKSILRDAVNDLSLHFLSKLGILVVKDIERDDIEFISRTLGCLPVAHVDSFSKDKLGFSEMVQEHHTGSGETLVKFLGVKHPGRTCSLLVRASNQLIIDETERSLHDALCVIRSLVKRKAMICGGGAPEIEMCLRLSEYSKTLPGVQGVCVRAFAEALEVIPYTLSENAGLHPVSIVTELRKRHAEGQLSAGIDSKKGVIGDIADEKVLQPVLVNISAIKLATEAVRLILKIDDCIGVM